MVKKLKQHRDDFDLRIASVTSLRELKQLRSDFLGKNGCVSLILKEMRSLPSDKKPEVGKHINEFKQNVENENTEHNLGRKKLAEKHKGRTHTHTHTQKQNYK